MDDSRTLPAIDALTGELRLLVKIGLPLAHLPWLPAMFSLQSVTQEIRGERELDHVLALEHALKRAVSLLGPGDRADAIRTLIGLDPRTRSWKRPRRRQAAKDLLLGPAWEAQTFRRRYEEPLLSDVAYALYKLESHVRLGFPLARDETEALQATRPAPAAEAVPVGQQLRLVSSNHDLKNTLFRIVDEAQECLVTTGSRSRDPDYLSCIEARLARQPALVHYRVLFGPPRSQILKDHLLRLIQIRHPQDRSQGAKTIFIGVFDDFQREPENFICASERRAFIRLPSITLVQRYDTGIEFANPKQATSYLRFVQELYSAGRVVESEPEILALSILNDGNSTS